MTETLTWYQRLSPSEKLKKVIEEELMIAPTRQLEATQVRLRRINQEVIALEIQVEELTKANVDLVEWCERGLNIKGVAQQIENEWWEESFQLRK